MADGAIYKDLSPTNQKRQPGRLPADLTRLRLLGFREFFIFKLMGEARQHRKRLSDVVETTWDHLKRAKHPVSYLRALLRKPVDYAYRVRMHRAESAEQETRELNDLHVHQAAKAIAGKAFASSDGLTRYFVSADATELTAHHCDEARPRVRIGAWASDFVAALDAGRIVPVTDTAAHVAAAVSRRSAADRGDAALAQPPLPSTAHMNELKRFLKLKTGGIALRSSSSEKFGRMRGSGPSSKRPALSDVSPQRTDLLKNLLRRNKS